MSSESAVQREEASLAQEIREIDAWMNSSRFQYTKRPYTVRHSSAPPFDALRPFEGRAVDRSSLETT